MRYRDAGVDITRSDALKEDLGRVVRATWSGAVRPIPGGFAGAMTFPGSEALVAATMDGVGTKLHLALALGRVADAAADLVYHGADDLLVHGARPLAFLDYLAQATLDPAVIADAVRGMARACAEVGAVLLGGETAEMPDTYLPGVIDIAGCMIGAVDPARVLDGSAVQPGDVVLGLGSNGLHTNGYSLARRVLAQGGVSLAAPLPGGDERTIGDALLASHRWYGPALDGPLADGQVAALAHVTGGGIAGNLVRVLPEGTHATIAARSWVRPPLFRWLQESGAIPEDDARVALNLGIGMLVVCRPAVAAGLAGRLAGAGEQVHPIGTIGAGARGVSWTE